ncbi:MAG: porin [Verrucomicrobia bacterium]|nr:porin [Verrucomicrobiota bacterium]
MKKTIPFLSATMLFAASVASPLGAAPTDEKDLQALRDRVMGLEQQLSAISRQLERKAEPATADADAAKVTVSEKGITLASADGATAIRLRGVAQFDARVFTGDGGGVLNNAFLLRRARVITEAVLAKNFSFQFVPEFGGSSVSIVDAAIGVTFDKSLQLKFGRFTPPLGLERLQGISWTYFNEASLVSNLVPNRDVGAQASGVLANGTFNYAVGVFGGAPDNASSTNTDFDNDKELIVRLMATPFKNRAESSLKGLTLGVAASQGRAKTTSGRTAGYKTDGQQTFFAYTATTTADGQNWRVAPQVDFRAGPLGVMGEYVVSAVNVRSARGDQAEIRNRAWQGTVGYVLTGEQSSFTGVVPRTRLDPAAGTWGAFEVVARYATLKVDDKAFPLFASAATNAQEASSVGLGLNWYLSKTVLFDTDWYHTRFGFNRSAPAVSDTQILRHDENAVIARVQIAF